MFKFINTAAKETWFSTTFVNEIKFPVAEIYPW